VLDEIDDERIFPINAYTVGYVRDLTHGGGIDVGLGGQFTINDVPDGLDRYYGNDLPCSFQIFLRPAVAYERSRHDAQRNGA
jgi:hypothetical protein